MAPSTLPREPLLRTRPSRQAPTKATVLLASSEKPRSLYGAIQERLFERAVVLGHHSERDEMLREQLAKFLHDHHRRTSGSD